MIGLLLGLSLINSDVPPVKYQGNTVAVLLTVDDTNTDDTCGVAPKDYVTLGCTHFDKKTGTAIVTMPNPCLVANKDFYAKILCHELGHVNGWNAEHNN